MKAGSGALTFGVPDSLGVPADLARHTLTLPYNDLEAVGASFVQRGNEVARLEPRRDLRAQALGVAARREGPHQNR